MDTTTKHYTLSGNKGTVIYYTAVFNDHNVVINDKLEATSAAYPAFAEMIEDNADFVACHIIDGNMEAGDQWAVVTLYNPDFKEYEITHGDMVATNDYTGCTITHVELLSLITVDIDEEA